MALARACDTHAFMSKAILITGAATRIGRVLAQGLSADGWAVAIHYHSSKDEATTLAAELENAVIVQADLANADSVETLIARAAHKVGAPLTGLINNASTYIPDSADDYSPDDYNTHMDVNLKAPLRLAHQFAKQLPSLNSNDKSACIINMIDQRVLRPTPDFFTYGVSKSALFAATKTMAQAFAPSIRVNAVGPGPTLQSIHQSDAEFVRERTSTLLGNGSPAETILDAVRYLLSATSVTGQMIAVDGGQHLRF